MEEELWEVDRPFHMVKDGWAEEAVALSEAAASQCQKSVRQLCSAVNEPDLRLGLEVMSRSWNERDCVEEALTRGKRLVLSEGPCY